MAARTTSKRRTKASRTASVKKAAATRKRNSAKRSAATKKAAATRKRNAAKRSRAGDNMAVIQCPHCGGDIELDYVEGLFDCPHCDEGNPIRYLGDELEIRATNPCGEQPLVEFDRKLDFWFGLVVPFLPPLLAIILFPAGDNVSSSEAWDALGYFLISVCLWPLVAIGLGICGLVSARRPLVVGSGLSFAVFGFLLLALLLGF